MSERRFYVFLEGPEFDLSMFALAGQVSEERVALAAKLMAAEWNRRDRARNCEHEWVDEFPGMRACPKCGNSEASWQRQQVEEAFA